MVSTACGASSTGGWKKFTAEVLLLERDVLKSDFVMLPLRFLGGSKKLAVDGPTVAGMLSTGGAIDGGGLKLQASCSTTSSEAVGTGWKTFA